MLGPFEVTEIIGQGAMGEVWRGRHRAGGQQVAIKVLRAELTGEHRHMEGFHREVQSIARLDHPGIVKIFDYGVIPEKAAREHQSLEAGGLWLAMEYAEGGSLEEIPSELNWTDLRGLLLQLLDALAHAHARDLVHRDLKPGNILCQPSETAGPPRWLLSDFGIAHIQDPTVSSKTGDLNTSAAGTPLFMAPEQLNGQWREYGPWTDLYALGCVAYLLASGKPPFVADSVMAIAVKHLSDKPPPLDPLIAVAPGFENWLKRLLKKTPRHRYRRAADAATDLVLLGDPADQTGRQTPESIEKLPTMSTATLATHDGSQPVRTLVLDDRILESMAAADRQDQPPDDEQRPQYLRRRTPSPPEDWRRLGEYHSPATIPATGKGIFGLRTPPYVGREQIRDQIWGHFHDVCRDERPRMIVIRGPAGLGKSSLMTWLATRTHELGVATPLIASHSPIMNPTDGLPQAFQAYLNATGLDRSELFCRLQQAYESQFGDESPDRDHLAAVVEWLSPLESSHEQSQDCPVPAVQFDTPLERYLVAQEILARIAAERPVILGIDDGQWAQDSLGFARHILADRSERNLPVLLVTTIRPDALDERLMERELLELLVDDEATAVVDLNPLDDDEQYHLVTHLLGLEKKLAERVTDHTKGIPLFALQLIEEWVSGELLSESDGGYTLGDDPLFPDDLDELLEQRVEQVTTSWRSPEQARLAMEIGAALGIDVEGTEWRRLCNILSDDVDEEFVDHLMVQGLALPHSGGWRFRLPLYRDSLERISRRQGRWSNINSAIAEHIDSAAQNGTCLAERRARHLLEAELHDRAIPLLWEAIGDRMKKSAYLQARGLLSLLESTVDALDLPQDHRQRRRLEIRRAETHRFRGDVDGGETLLEELLSTEDLDDDLRADAHRVAANYANLGADYGRALEHYKKARDLFSSIDDYRGLCRSLDGMGWVYLSMGRIGESRKAYAAGYNEAQRAGLSLEAAWCLWGVAETSLFMGDPSGIEDAQRALELFDELGCRSGMGIAHRTLGDYARGAGDLGDARRHYERTRHLANMIGHVFAEFTVALLGFCDLAEGDFDAAKRRFSSFNEAISEDWSPGFRPAGDLGLLVIAAHRNDWDGFDELAERLENTLTPDTPLRRDFMHMLQEIIAACNKAGDRERAETARVLLETLQ